MAQVKDIKVFAELKVLLELNEEEVRALDGIFGYGVDEFLKFFYEKMGETYLKPYEAGIRSLHKTIRNDVGKSLAKIDKAKKLIYENS